MGDEQLTYEMSKVCPANSGEFLWPDIVK